MARTAEILIIIVRLIIIRIPTDSDETDEQHYERRIARCSWVFTGIRTVRAAP